MQIIKDNWGKIAALILFFASAWFLKNGGKELASAFGLSAMTLIMPNDKGRKAEKEVKQKIEETIQAKEQILQEREVHDENLKYVEAKIKEIADADGATVIAGLESILADIRSRNDTGE